MYQKIVKRTLRVPVDNHTRGNGETLARQLDVALMRSGFKLSAELLKQLSGLHPVSVKEIADNVLSAVRELVGDHREHNVYFIDFPNNVPDTREFWTECIIDALTNSDNAAKVASQLLIGTMNLLDLPKYGRYQHSYDDMLAAHQDFIPSVKDRMTILHLGKTFQEETLELYHSLAGSSVPLNESDRDLLYRLSECCLFDTQPEVIPVRENRAIINRVRLENDHDILIDTTTDVLRLAVFLSDGDVTLEEATSFKSFSRKTRRIILSALDKLVEKSPSKLADVNQYRERWKRLAEKLHPYEYKQLAHALDVFAVARRDKRVKSLVGKMEVAFATGNMKKVVELLADAPGVLFRNLDRILRSCCESEFRTLLVTVERVIPKVSGRVILSVREHLQNRIDEQVTRRIFANSKGTAWTQAEDREALDSDRVHRLFEIFDNDLARRISAEIPESKKLLIDPDILDVALPLSDKNKSNGFGVLPRGSEMKVEDGILRFFIYWKQRFRRTDFDLSVIMLDENFRYLKHVSWTDLRYEEGYAVHSGDLTDAANGASEFIDIDLDQIDCKYIIPSVNVFSGEGFEEVEESFFGFMSRTREQMGKPFEAATVRMRSDLRGKGKVALPLVFIRDDYGNWTAKWLHLFLKGQPNFNAIENNKNVSTIIAKTVLERKYITYRYLLNLMEKNGVEFCFYFNPEDRRKIIEHFSDLDYIGFNAPSELPKDSKTYTLTNIHDLIPA